MSEMKTTPGPWVFRDGGETDCDGYVARQSGDYVERICTLTGPSCEDIVRADGRLIASAPTLLSALKAMDEALTRGWGNPSGFDWPRASGDGVPEAWIQIRSAISQADGR